MKKDQAHQEPEIVRSEAFAEGRFRPHGYTLQWPQGNILHGEAEGPFNREAIAAMNRARQHLLASFEPNGPYAHVNTIRGSLVMAQDAMQEYALGFSQYDSGDHGLPAAMAWIVTPEVEGTQLMKPYFERIFQSLGIPFQVFKEPQAAESWVLDLIQKAGNR